MLTAEYTIPGLHVRDHLLPVPLSWAAPDAERIDLFVREVVDPSRRSEDLPLLCFLQGGPGGKGPRPLQGSPPWLKEMLKTHRVILPDQRGTGRSSRVDAASISRFDGDAGADYLNCFRADSIVRDVEHVRKTLYGGRRWETLGQSYGGFLTLTYLSFAPEGLATCYVAGGLASLRPSAAEVYRRTYPRVRSKTRAYYERYPADVGRVAQIAELLAASDVRLPDGDRLTVQRFQTIGIDLGMTPGNENIHWLVDEAIAAAGRLSDHFLASMMRLTSYDDNPLFAALQESIYADGENGPTAWAAARERGRHADFDVTARPLLFTGEMMYPWMFDEVRSLRPFRAAVEALARRERHTRLYDLERLRSNEVPVSAVVYFDDFYVDAGLSLETAAQVGNLTHWVTNEFEHDGIRQDGEVIRRLRSMVMERGGPVE